MTTTRRQTIAAAAWTLPVIAAAVAAPASAASIPVVVGPLECRRLPGKGKPLWLGIYSDGTTINMPNGEAMSGEFGMLCRASADTEKAS